MTNVNFITFDDGFGNEYTNAIIENADGGFTSMSKAEYDRLQAEQSTPNLAGSE
jgi:hypothetical protein